MRQAALERQAAPRGSRRSFDRVLQGWDVDLAGASGGLSLSDTVALLLAIPGHWSLGTTGVRGRLYKLHADVLAPVFMEAFQDMTVGGTDIPQHLADFVWHAVPKRAGADAAEEDA